MKQLYFVISLLLFNFISAQNVIFSSSGNFKEKLLSSDGTNIIAYHLGNWYGSVDTNSDGEIQVSEALDIKRLSLSPNYDDFGNPIDLLLTDLVGISSFTNLEKLNAPDNAIHNVDLPDMPFLKEMNIGNNSLLTFIHGNMPLLNLLDLYGNELTTIALTGMPVLETLSLTNSNLTQLDLSDVPLLNNLQCSHNNITSLDFSSTPLLITLEAASNPLGSIDPATIQNVKFLKLYNTQLTALDLSTLDQLYSLNCSDNQITSLNLTGLANLNDVDCSNNQLQNLSMNGLVSLKFIQIGNNPLMDISNLGSSASLETLWMGNNQMTTIELENYPGLKHLSVYDDAVLENVLAKNGNLETLNLSLTPQISFICVDDNLIGTVQNNMNSLGYTNCVVSSYCSFVPGGEYYTIQGTVKFDSAANGCGTADPAINSIKISISNSDESGLTVVGSSGLYTIPVSAGIHNVTPVLENPAYFNVSPSSVPISFPVSASPFSQNFCVTPNGSHNDLELFIVPIIAAAAGFDATYKLIYKNKGTTVANGNVTTSFDDSIADVVSASPAIDTQTTNSISWNYTNLQPFETREVTFTLHINGPMDTPAVNDGDILHFLSDISSGQSDEFPADNAQTFDQVVVNSLDPNNKTCLEGSIVSSEVIGNYVHYLIRFENEGTANAQNIVVRDDIDPLKYDISSIVPIDGSHDFTTRITGNRVEFIFENIQLPFDDALNDGYVAFKIKTLPTLQVGDTFSNFASIYFDYNFPVITEPATTIIQELNVTDNDLSKSLVIYPNPTKNSIRISTLNSSKINAVKIYTLSGQLILVVSNPELSAIDVSQLASGTYFLKAESEMGSSVGKLIKE